jgi:elongator complex protein 3
MTHRHATDLSRYREPLLAILTEIVAHPDLTRRAYTRLLRQHQKDGQGFFSADDLVAGYRLFAEQEGLLPFDPAVLDRIRLKPIRTASGVTPLTLFTKPFPCPGECIFCPNDVRMPKSYLRDEPGAQRAEAHQFDPYRQTYMRLQSFQNTGHPTDKIELIILGGTWSFYPESYQIWFVARAFQALHDFGAGRPPAIDPTPPLIPIHTVGEGTYNQQIQALYGEQLRRDSQLEAATWAELYALHQINESSACRCVGLVIETRPDYTTPEEVIRLRRLGCTKVQLGFQSLSDRILRLNKRGHTVNAIRKSVKLFRSAGFKIHAHWMPNLLGATPDSDREDYALLFTDPDFRPDELKIYPCSLIESAELMRFYERGEWSPYSTESLTELIVNCLVATPEYCRLTRVIRDIPGTDIVVGNKVTNLRQVAELELKRRGQRSVDIRAREVGHAEIDPATLILDQVEYESSAGREFFLQYIVQESRQIAGFLRFLLPSDRAFIGELDGAALIREVHIYGQQLSLGQRSAGRAQHSGLGSRLIEVAVEVAKAAGYTRIAVISAVGTRGYYRQRGFQDGALYQVRDLAEG